MVWRDTVSQRLRSTTQGSHRALPLQDATRTAKGFEWAAWAKASSLGGAIKSSQTRRLSSHRYPRNPLARSRPKPHPYGAGRVCRNERCSGEGGSDLGRRCNTVAPHVDDLEVITLIRWRLHSFWFSAHPMFSGKAFSFRSLAAGSFSVITITSVISPRPGLWNPANRYNKEGVCLLKNVASGQGIQHHQEK